MATFTTNTQVDFSQAVGFFEAGPTSVLSATGSQIIVRSPDGQTQIYGGSFFYTYSDGYQFVDWNNSSFTSISAYAINLSFVGITGMSVSGAVWKSYADTNNGDGLTSYIFRGNDSISGSSYHDVLWGYEGNDILNGGAGIDTMVGGGGNDTYYVDDSGDITTETSALPTEIDKVFSSVTLTLGANIENLTLTGANAINGTGNTLANTLIGNSYANALNGGAGADTMTGGLGNDTYYVDNAIDRVIEIAGAGSGTDTVMSDLTWRLGVNIENLTLTGNTAINGTGNTLANTLTGNSANNILNGMAGNDTMLGGLGNDTYIVNATGDVVTEEAGQGIDTVKSAISYTLGANLENLILTDTLASNGTGNILNNTLSGNSAANVLKGGGGRDILNGTLGNDKLTGGTGMDTFVFDSSLDAANNKDTITDFSVVDDIVRLDQTIFTSLTATGNLAADNFRSSTTGAAANADDYILYKTSTGTLFYDADGSGTDSSAIAFVTLTGIPTLTAADFFVIV